MYITDYNYYLFLPEHEDIAVHLDLCDGGGREGVAHRHEAHTGQGSPGGGWGVRGVLGWMGGGEVVRTFEPLRLYVGTGVVGK